MGQVADPRRLQRRRQRGRRDGEALHLLGRDPPRPTPPGRRPREPTPRKGLLRLVTQGRDRVGVGELVAQQRRHGVLALIGGQQRDPAASSPGTATSKPASRARRVRLLMTSPRVAGPRAGPTAHATSRPKNTTGPAQIATTPAAVVEPQRQRTVVAPEQTTDTSPTRRPAPAPAGARGSSTSSPAGLTPRSPVMSSPVTGVVSHDTPHASASWASSCRRRTTRCAPGGAAPRRRPTRGTGGRRRRRGQEQSRVSFQLPENSPS